MINRLRHILPRYKKALLFPAIVLLTIAQGLWALWPYIHTTSSACLDCAMSVDLLFASVLPCAAVALAMGIFYRFKTRLAWQTAISTLLLAACWLVTDTAIFDEREASWSTYSTAELWIAGSLMAWLPILTAGAAWAILYRSVHIQPPNITGMADIQQYLDGMAEHDQKYYRHKISTFPPHRQQALAALIEKLLAAGAARPLSWAFSETDEGIPQFARFRILQELYGIAEDVDGNAGGATEYEPGAGELYEAMVAAVGEEKCKRFLAGYAKSMLYNVVNLLDDGNPYAERDGFSWRLIKTNEHGDELQRGIDGLHEDFLEFGNEVKPSNP